ncbi:MAG: hypothetical protein INR69_06335 [Mucilaginibacter polytrichastri]|nr:hypothetical protein [Mucilaginibacter polytrichastri]
MDIPKPENTDLQLLQQFNRDTTSDRKLLSLILGLSVLFTVVLVGLIAVMLIF